MVSCDSPVIVHVITVWAASGTTDLSSTVMAENVEGHFHVFWGMFLVS